MTTILDLVAAPLTSLLKGAPKRLLWTLAATEALLTLKQRFTQVLILHHQDAAM